jgi:hypothetical protein
MRKLLVTFATLFALNASFGQEKKILIYLNVDKFDDMGSINYIKTLERSFKETKVKAKRIYEYRHVLNTEHDSLLIKKHLSEHKPNMLWRFTLTDTKTTEKKYWSYSPMFGIFSLIDKSLPRVMVLSQNTIYDTKFRVEIELTDLDNSKTIDRNVITDGYYTGYFNELKYNKVIE